MRGSRIVFQAQLITDKTVYKIGEYITFSLSGFPPNSPYFFGLGLQDSSIPWGYGGSITDANGNDGLAFKIGDNVPEGDWFLWIWDDLGTPALSTPVKIEAETAPGIPQLAIIVIPVIAAILVVGAVLVRK